MEDTLGVLCVAYIEATTEHNEAAAALHSAKLSLANAERRMSQAIFNQEQIRYKLMNFGKP